MNKMYWKWQCKIELIKTMTKICKMRNRHVHIILLSISFISQESFQQNLLTKQSLN